ncbi:MAG: N-acetylmuramoyl-L-alanine amidase cwlL [Patescibacteria group bacterium]|jgi:cytoskeletal protein RodZ|nr:N-acetylmuramoyl-L-alanine amidase cwlL [Patescibacteria group bacterium]
MFFETLKANLLVIIFFIIIFALGYWGVNSLQVEPEEFDYVSSDVRPIVVNEPTGFDPSKGVTDRNITTNPSVSTSTGSQTTNSPTPTTPTAPATDSSTNSEYSKLVAALEKLISDNVFMKKGSRGTRVGTVQEFLNIYNGTDSKIDNDYGATTESQIRNFQRSEGLTADGQAGPSTYRKMIEWLNKQ